MWMSISAIESTLMTECKRPMMYRVESRNDGERIAPDGRALLLEVARIFNIQIRSLELR